MDRNLAMSRNLLNITIIKNCSFYFLIYFIDYAITVVPFPPLYSLPSCTPTPIHIPPLQFISMGRTYKFFGFYISYTILNLPLSIFYLPSIYATFYLYLFPLSPPAISPLITLHVISISVFLFMFQFFVSIWGFCLFFF